MKTKYEVAVIYRGRTTYIVEADGEEAALDAAKDLWEVDDPGISTGVEYEEVEDIRIEQEMKKTNEHI